MLDVLYLLLITNVVGWQVLALGETENSESRCE